MTEKSLIGVVAFIVGVLFGAFTILSEVERDMQAGYWVAGGKAWIVKPAPKAN